MSVNHTRGIYATGKNCTGQVSFLKAGNPAFHAFHRTFHGTLILIRSGCQKVDIPKRIVRREKRDCSGPAKSSTDRPAHNNKPA